MRTIEIEIPDGYEAKWVDGVLTLVDEQPKVEFKFKVGDKVTFKGDKTPPPYTITDRFVAGKDSPAYKLDDCENVDEDVLELYIEPKDITERIKTLGDACRWCNTHGFSARVQQYTKVLEALGEYIEKDILAYLKLRIITCALNEGWEPTFEDGEERWYPYYSYDKADSWIAGGNIYCNDGRMLYFKSPKLAIYAATQFKDIYMDFCKGKE